MKCPSCAAAVPATNQFCGVCGSAVPSSHHDSDETVALAAVTSSGSVSVTLDEGRFLPGTLLAGRYRITGLLGRGGMGEVYRATDLTLGQAVALKFLPASAVDDEQALARFHNEVRMARQVSHPNVCRVYDIGVIDGTSYLSMEYVDGEDLGSLLLRIGRIPHDKAVEMARKLCAGLAAAHEKGVLHRDLKPANIMIDGRGQLKIMDFGLAGIAENIKEHEIRHGTPAYMAPEQLAGKEVTVRSDIYSLGLVLYEMFTGKRAFAADTLAELVRLREHSTPASLTTLVHEMDPAVERVVLRCLESDPKNRPSSALAVAAALPGGDPLAAALAAGETPSPEMVAAAGATEGMRPAVAIACLAGVLAGLAAMIFAVERLSAPVRNELENPPEVLAAKSREMLQSFGYTQRPTDTAYSFHYSEDALNYLGRPKQPASSGHQPALLHFSYRTSPRYLAATHVWGTGSVTNEDPPPILSGMTTMELDGHGRLVTFHAMPPQFENSPGRPSPVDWKTLFSAAGLDFSRFQSAAPQWLPLSAFDERTAWVEQSKPIALRVEAAAWRGKPVYFEVLGPWSRPGRTQEFQADAANRAGRIINVILVYAVIAGACFLARYNIRKGRGDRRGAFRVAVFAFSVIMLSYVFGIHHVPADAEREILEGALGTSLFATVMLSVLYVALEPYVRRYWPQSIMSWSRILTGRAKDPVVGAHLLIGLLFAVLWALFIVCGFLVTAGTGPLVSVSTDVLLGFSHTASALADLLAHSVQGILVMFFILFILRVVLRRDWLAASAFIAIMGTIATLRTPNPWLAFPFRFLQYTAFTFVLMRFGVVPGLIGFIVANMLISVPLTTDLSAWYAGIAYFSIGLVAAAAIYAFRRALAGRPLFR